MKLSVFYHHVAEAAAQAGRTIDETLSRVRSLGIEYVELDYADIACSEEIPSRIKKAGMGVSSIYRFYDFGSSDGLTILHRLTVRLPSAVKRS